MKKDFLEIGKIVGVHGIKGLLKVQYWCDNADFFATFKTLYLKENENYKPLKIQSAKQHGNIILLKISDVDTIEAAETFRSFVLYIKREDAKLEEGRYFIEELIGLKVYDSNTNEQLGVLSEVSQYPANDIWHIKKDGKEYLMPAIDECIVSVDIDNEKAYINPLKGIFDDED